MPVIFPPAAASGSTGIDDNNQSTSTTYSSAKIETEVDLEAAEAAVDTFLALGLQPRVNANSPTTFVSRASVIPAGYSGNVEYNSETYPGHAEPSDQEIGDAWIRRSA